MAGLSLVRILGIPLYIRYSFVFLLVAAFYGGVLHGVGGRAVVLLVIGFSSVLAHEVGHALAARALRVPVVAISLHALGGQVHVAGLPRAPRDEAVIALAGPLVSLVLGGACKLIEWQSGSIWWEYAMAINLLVAGANMLPALPLDGGRVLRALLSERVGHQRATERTLWVSRAVALGMVAVAWPSGYWILAVFGLSLWVASREEPSVQRRWREGLPVSARHVEVLDLEGRAAGRRATRLGSTYVIQRLQVGDLRRWAVRTLDGRLLLVTDTSLEANGHEAASVAPPRSAG